MLGSWEANDHRERSKDLTHTPNYQHIKPKGSIFNKKKVVY